MLNRRAFVGSALGAAALAPAATTAEKRTRFYVLESFKMRFGSGVQRVHDYLTRAALPAMRRVHDGPTLVLEAFAAPHIPEILTIYGFPSLDELWRVHTKAMADETLLKGLETMEASEPAFESIDTTLLLAADYSPEPVALDPPPSAPRVFELRVYHSPTLRQLHDLHERFSGSETGIFHRAGIQPVFYSSTMIGVNVPNLAYLIPFEDLAAREKAWAAFSADPEWAKVRAESVRKSGEVVASINLSLYRATAYSPIR